MQAPASPRLTFGLVPHHHDGSTRALLNRLCEHLSREAGIAVAPHCAPSPNALASAISAGRVHVAWSSPMLLVLARELASVVPLLASVREGTASYHAALFVRDDSPIRCADDLRGRVVAWVAPTSAAGYVLPRAALSQRGLDPAALFARELFCETHGEVARAVLEGRADVGATFAVFEHGDPAMPLARAGFLEAFPTGGARVVDVAGPAPADMIVAAATVPIHVRARVAAAFPRLASDAAARAPIRELIGADDFAPLTPHAVRELYDLARAARDASHHVA